MVYNLDSFMKDLSEWDIELSEVQKQQFIDYYELLVEWNSFMNLTTITEFDDVIKKHFVDSISLIKDLTSESVKEIFAFNAEFKMLVFILLTSTDIR